MSERIPSIGEEREPQTEQELMMALREQLKSGDELLAEINEILARKDLTPEQRKREEAIVAGVREQQAKIYDIFSGEKIG